LIDGIKFDRLVEKADQHDIMSYYLFI